MYTCTGVDECIGFMTIVEDRTASAPARCFSESAVRGSYCTIKLGIHLRALLWSTFRPSIGLPQDLECTRDPEEGRNVDQRSARKCMPNLIVQ